MEDVKVLQEQVRTYDDIDYDKGKALSLTHLVDLFIRPKRFFQSQIALGKTPYIAMIALVVGISNIIDRIDQQLLKTQYGNSTGLLGPIGAIVDSWIAFWALLFVLGGIGAYFLWLMGGWWYNVRLEWCEAKRHEEKTGRIVYIYTSFIFALPSVLLVLGQTFFYPNYRAAFTAETLWPTALLIFPFWAVVNSYKAVNTVFEPNRKKAKIWFLILPIIVYIIAFGVFATLFAFLGSSKL